MHSLRLVLPVLFGLVILTNAQDCEDAKASIQAFAKKLLAAIEQHPCKKCSVHMKDIQSNPNVEAFARKQMLVEYKKAVKGDMPISDKEYDDIVKEVKRECIMKYKDKELCKEMKPKEEEIKKCVVGICMGKLNIFLVKAHFDKHCQTMKAFMKQKAPGYEKMIKDWPKNHKNVCK